MYFFQFQRRHPTLPLIVSMLMYVAIEVLASLASKSLRKHWDTSSIVNAHSSILPGVPAPLMSAPPTCMAFPLHDNLTIPPPINPHKVAILSTGLEESDIEDHVKRSNWHNKHEVLIHLRMTKAVARLLTPALNRYISRVLPDLERALTSSHSIIAVLNLSVRTKNHFTEDHEFDNAISTNIEDYAEIQRSLGPQDDAMYGIMYMIRGYLDDLESIISSSAILCQAEAKSTIFRWYLNYLTGTDTQPTQQDRENCSRSMLVKNHLAHFANDLESALENIRDYFDVVQSHIDGLGDRSETILLAGIGRTISREQYITLFSTLACDCARLLDILKAASEIGDTA